MGQRQKKKNLLRSKEKLTRQVRELQGKVEALKIELMNERVGKGALLNSKEEMRRRLQYLSTMPVYHPLTNGLTGIGEIETQRIPINPVPYGMACTINEWELDQLVKEKERELAMGIAEGLLKSNLCQIIIRSGKETGGPLDWTPEQRCITTIGVKLYVVPWEVMQIYRGDVKQLKTLALSGTENYAEMCAGMTPEQRERWLAGNRGDFI